MVRLMMLQKQPGWEKRKQYGRGMNCDYDNDGDQDFCVLNFASPFMDDPEGNPSVLYQNNNGIFTDVASSSGIEHTDGSAWCGVG